MTIAIKAQSRTETGTRACNKLREAGVLPGVVYGAGGETQSISLNAKEFTAVWVSAGESTVLNLTGVGDDKSVLIHDVSVDVIYGKPLHVDLFAIRTDQVVEVSVPFTFTGVAPAEKDLGGTLSKTLHELTIEALPKDLPHEIEVDISSLVTFEDGIAVKDLKLPAGVTAITGEDELVVNVREAVEIEEEVVEAETDVADVEVEKKGKEEEGEEGGEEKKGE